MSNQPKYSSRNPPTSNRQLLIILGLFLAFIVSVFWLLGLVINNLILLVPPSFEQKLGSIIVPVYEKQAKPSPTQDALNRLVDRLETNLPESQAERDYQVLYVPQETVNAIAIPGDTIIIYQGLLEDVESENELMMVLGHELGHFANRDHLRGIGRALTWRIAIAYLFGDISILQSTVGTAVQAIANAQYSQSQEQQADEFGLELLNDTYGHVAGATDFFARLSQEKRSGLAFLSSHPAPKKRVREIKQLIQAKDYEMGTLKPLPQTLANPS